MDEATELLIENSMTDEEMFDVCHSGMDYLDSICPQCKQVYSHPGCSCDYLSGGPIEMENDNANTETNRQHCQLEPLFFEEEKSKILAIEIAEKQLTQGEENISLGEKFLNNVANVDNVATFDLSKAIDADDEELQGAIAIIELAITDCRETPGVLFAPAFTDAVKVIRQDPELWAEYRVKIKKAKPSGVLLSDIDDATRPDSDFASDDGGAAGALIELVTKQGELFFDTQADSSFVSVDIDGVSHTLAIGSKAFIEWLSFTYYTNTKTDKTPGKSASESAIKQASFALSGIAKFDGTAEQVHLRIANHNGGHYIFIGDERLQVIEVLPTGWRVLGKSPVKFWRSSSMQALPIPQAGGDLSQLWSFINIPKDDQLLVLAWLLECFRSETGFPVLALSGQQGSAKSSTQNKLRQLIDHNSVNLRAAPKSVEDVFVSAGCNWLSSFENISHLSPNMQDALCTLATGGGFASRTLYTNKEESIIEVKRPVIINSIPRVVTAQDLNDRAISIECPKIAYREEVEINAKWELAKPAIFGGLMDLFVKTLALLPQVKLENPPRMADFTRLGEAMTQALGHVSGVFDALYKANRAESVAAALESSPVGVAVRDMVDDYNGLSKVVFYGTIKALYDKLSAGTHHSGEGWPRSPKGLSEALKRQTPALYSLGIEINQSSKPERTESGRGFTIKISKGGNVVNVGNIVLKKTAGERYLEPKVSGFLGDTERF